jgi:hypothetical protein
MKKARPHCRQRSYNTAPYSPNVFTGESAGQRGNALIGLITACACSHFHPRMKTDARSARIRFASVLRPRATRADSRTLQDVWDVCANVVSCLRKKSR